MFSFLQSLAGSPEERLCQVLFEILKHLDIKEVLGLPLSQAAALHVWLCCSLFVGEGERDRTGSGLCAEVCGETKGVYVTVV